ncbi:MAG: hypothetical protein KAS32_13710 [Candidatus Peribacteraceae bacterium]|nr:hypothetical protein [Candidatus Peribacteraceae bacterium]
MSDKKRVNISLSKETFDEIEKRRGLIPRSTYINDILKKELPKYIEEMKHG